MHRKAAELTLSCEGRQHHGQPATRCISACGMQLGCAPIHHRLFPLWLIIRSHERPVHPCPWMLLALSLIRNPAAGGDACAHLDGGTRGIPEGPRHTKPRCWGDPGQEGSQHCRRGSLSAAGRGPARLQSRARLASTGVELGFEPTQFHRPGTTDRLSQCRPLLAVNGKLATVHRYLMSWKYHPCLLVGNI
jgi:hypothetical protein